MQKLPIEKTAERRTPSVPTRAFRHCATSICTDLNLNRPLLESTYTRVVLGSESGSIEHRDDAFLECFGDIVPAMDCQDWVYSRHSTAEVPALTSRKADD